MLTALALHLIRWYQRHLSPRKGYACAYRVVYGGSGCSGVGYRLIRRYGAVSGYLLLRKRLARCHFVAVQQRQIQRWAQYQRGDCVPDCIVPDCNDIRIPRFNHYCWDVIDCGVNMCECSDLFSRNKEQPKKKH